MQREPYRRGGGDGERECGENRLRSASAPLTSITARENEDKNRKEILEGRKRDTRRIGNAKHETRHGFSGETRYEATPRPKGNGFARRRKRRGHSTREVPVRERNESL